MRVLAIAAAAVAGCLLGACSSATTGTGAGSGASSRPDTTVGTSPAATPSMSASLPAPSGSISLRSTPPSSPTPSTSSAPPTLPTPKGCLGGKCHKLRSAELGAGYSVTVYSGPSPSGRIGAAYLQLALGGVPVFWKVIDGESPGRLICSTAPSPNCVLVDVFGAHGSSARGFVREGDVLVQFDTVQSDTTVTIARDLNGDGWIDAAHVVDTYQPDYATGKVYWSTSLSDGRKFTVSGCTAPKRKLAPPPTAPLTGACTSS